MYSFSSQGAASQKSHSAGIVKQVTFDDADGDDDIFCFLLPTLCAPAQNTAKPPQTAFATEDGARRDTQGGSWTVARRLRG